MRRSHRREEKAFLLEGARAIRDVLEAGGNIEELFVAPEAPLLPALDDRNAGTVVHRVTPSVLAAITDSVTPQGMVAVARSPLTTLEEIRPTSGLVLVLAGLGDPGNVGTLIRTAAAASADAVVLASGTSDALNPKTARAATAALFTVPLVADVDLADAMGHLSGLGYTSIGTDAGAGTTMYDCDLQRPAAIVVGNEAHGLSPEHRELLDELVSIPMPGSVESLNAATAGAVVVFETLRQRRLSFGRKEDGRD